MRDILTVDSGDFATFRTPQGKPFKDVLAPRRTKLKPCRLNPRPNRRYPWRCAPGNKTNRPR